MSKLIVIIGITGTQGSSVATTFSSLPGWRIRGTTRNPSSPTAQTLIGKGIEIIRADLDKPDSLIAAFKDANAIFAVTDFWQHFNNPAKQDLAAKMGTTINKYAFDLEVTQGKNIAEAAAHESVIKNLERFVFSSLSDVRNWSKGKYTWVYHFDSKAVIENHIKENLPELAEKMSTVQIGFYMTNWKWMKGMVPKKQEDGSFTMFKAEGDDKLVPFVATEKDTGEFVRALVELPRRKNLLGVSEMMDWEGWTKTWGEVLGVTTQLKFLPMEEFMQQYPSILREEVSQSFLYNAEFGWTGGDPDVLTPDEVVKMGVDIPRTSVAEYIRGEDWSSVL